MPSTEIINNKNIEKPSKISQILILCSIYLIPLIFEIVVILFLSLIGFSSYFFNESESNHYTITLIMLITLILISNLFVSFLIKQNTYLTLGKLIKFSLKVFVGNIICITIIVLCTGIFPGNSGGVNGIFAAVVFVLGIYITIALFFHTLFIIITATITLKWEKNMSQILHFPSWSITVGLIILLLGILSVIIYNKGGLSLLSKKDNLSLLYSQSLTNQSNPIKECTKEFLEPSDTTILKNNHQTDYDSSFTARINSICIDNYEIKLTFNNFRSFSSYDSVIKFDINFNGFVSLSPKDIVLIKSKINQQGISYYLITKIQ